MASKILSFICHVPPLMPSAFPTAPTPAKTNRVTERKTDSKASGGHFTAIYENERFVRFKYINNTND
ncbi:hypothetical protein [Hymenobacter cellulosivorans]|uniref:Uncharacterized protein n=1 Tax=Hymenobacter cellulosivorans TaxID=2932249 RepID=A0ABY4FKE1_9BACT|nr:hypothetical protein [Hymenobacter cellulosivorans]UOQ55451.1 hypothetical protein MUN80_11990 [Hymenobacter cellulosivorans]